jgi:hypothetical protein
MGLEGDYKQKDYSMEGKKSNSNKKSNSSQKIQNCFQVGYRS